MLDEQLLGHSPSYRHREVIDRSSVIRFGLVCLFAVFISFETLGFQALLPTLRDEGVYHNLCDRHTSYNVTCDDQTLALERMLSISGSGLNFVILLVGLCSERWGPRICVAMGIVFKLVGITLFVLSDEDMPAWLAAYTLMTVGGTFIIFPAYPLPFQMFPLRIAGFVFSLLMMAIDASAIVYALMNYLHFHAGLSLQTMMMALAVIVVIFAFFIRFIYPPKPSAMLEFAKSFSRSVGQLNDVEPVDESWLVDDGIANIMKRSPFWIVTFWSAAFVTCCYWYLSTLHNQLLWLTEDNDSQTDTLLNVFAIMFPVAGIFSPISGWFLTEKVNEKGSGQEFVRSTLFLALVSVMMGITSIVHSYPLQYLTIGVVVFNRFLYFVVAPNLVTKMYGKRGPSLIYGWVLAISAIVNLSNYGTVQLATHTLDDDYTLPNIVINAWAVISSLIVIRYAPIWAASKERLRLSGEVVAPGYI